MSLRTYAGKGSRFCDMEVFDGESGCPKNITRMCIARGRRINIFIIAVEMISSLGRSVGQMC